MSLWIELPRKEPIAPPRKELLIELIPLTMHYKNARAGMDACAEAGVTVALELGPGAALSRMLHARHPQIECRSVSDFRSLDGVRKWLARHVD